MVIFRMASSAAAASQTTHAHSAAARTSAAGSTRAGTALFWSSSAAAGDGSMGAYSPEMPLYEAWGSSACRKSVFIRLVSGARGSSSRATATSQM